jgi:hypothetical protein
MHNSDSVIRADKWVSVSGMPGDAASQNQGPLSQRELYFVLFGRVYYSRLNKLKCSIRFAVHVFCFLFVGR